MASRLIFPFLFLLVFCGFSVQAQWMPERTFRLSPGDRIDVSVFRVHTETEQLLDGTLRLSGTGHVELPNGSRVKVSGTSMRSVNAHLEEGFRDRTDLSGLNVRAHVVRINDRPIVCLFGEVGTPGHTTWQSGMTLADLFEKAGGLKPASDRRRINVFREGRHTRLDIREEGVAESFELKAGDIILVELSLLRF